MSIPVLIPVYTPYLTPPSMSTSRLRYYYQVDLNGNPIPSTNCAKVKKPKSFGKGQVWIEFTPIAMSQPCCPSPAPIPFVSTGRKWRYYIRISDSTNLPISGTLEKRKFPPPTYRWQEVDGTYCC